MYYLILELNAEPWAIGDVGIHRKGGKVGAHVGRNVQLDAYQQAVKEEAFYYLEGQLPSIWPLQCDVRLEIYIWRQQADYEAASGKRVRKHRADNTNMLKATEDALQGWMIANDTQVTDTHVRMMAQGPDVHPLLVIGVGAADEPSFSELPEEVRFDVQNKLAGNGDLFTAPAAIETEGIFDSLRKLR